jgi:hypothetical protein
VINTLQLDKGAKLSARRIDYFGTVTDWFLIFCPSFFHRYHQLLSGSEARWVEQFTHVKYFLCLMFVTPCMQKNSLLTCVYLISFAQVSPTPLLLTLLLMSSFIICNVASFFLPLFKHKQQLSFPFPPHFLGGCINIKLSNVQK